MSVVARPSLTIDSGICEALKWAALVGMVVDHVNTIFFGRDLGLWATVIGRMVFPVFGLVLAYNLSRPGIDVMRILRRLVLVAMLATPVYVMAFVGRVPAVPLNVMWLFAVAVGVLHLWERGHHVTAFLLFGVAGLLVEYSWAGIGFVLAAAVFFRNPSQLTGSAVIAGLCMVCALNGNAYALLAVPLVALASHGAVEWPRVRWAFYAAYPAHLAVLALLRVE